MAERRMFAKTIVLSDSFLDMPMSSRCLYFTLGMLADDDGFVNSPKSVMRQCGATLDDMNILISKKFIIAMDGGVIVIKHWKVHNYIQSDRYIPTKYKDLKDALSLDENKAYTTCIQDVSIVYTQDSIGKDSIGKVSIEEDSTVKDSIRTIVEYLNESLGTHYKKDTPKTISLIKARLNEGFTVDDFKLVIDKKVKAWGDDKRMDKYLRPETLFGTKFEGYLNERETLTRTEEVDAWV